MEKELIGNSPLLEAILKLKHLSSGLLLNILRS